MPDDDLPFKVMRTNSHDEVVARANNLIVGRAAYETARRMYRMSVLITATARRSSRAATRRHRIPTC